MTEFRAGTLSDAFLNADGAFYTAILTDHSLEITSSRPYVGCKDLPFDDVQTWEKKH